MKHERPNRGRRPIRDRMRRAAFLLLIWLPLLIIAGGRDASFPLPRSVGELFFFPRDFMFYFSHDFAPRHALARTHGRIKAAIGDQPSDFGQVIVGDDGWMFLRLALLNSDLPQEELRRRLAVHQQRADFCRALGVAYYVVPVPAKENLYSEHLPERLRSHVPQTEITQLQRYLLTKSDSINCVTLLKPLGIWKQRGELFFKSDVHWNELGGYVASLETMRQILPQFGFAAPSRELPFTIEMRTTKGGNEAQILGIRNQVTEAYPVLTVADGRSPTFADGRPIQIDLINFTDFKRTGMRTICPAGELESGMIFHDSFGPALAPFISRYFQACDFHWQEFSPALVEERRPKVVIDLANTF